MIIILLTIVLFLVFLELEKRTPFLKDPPEKIRESYLTNLKLFLFNDTLLSLLSLGSLFYIAERFSSFGLLSGVETSWIIHIFTFLLLDLTLYLWHRIDHKFLFLWSFHQIHHSDPCLNVSTAFRYHIGALILGVLVKALFIVLIGINAWIVVLYESIITLFVIFQHCNISFPGENKLAWVFIVPRLHRVHHSTSLKQRDKNFGIVFSFWDRLFGTYENSGTKGIGLTHIKHMSMPALTKLGFLDARNSLKNWYYNIRQLHLSMH